MGIRILALYAVVAGLSIYAWKDWYKSLCGLVVLMAVLANADMPRTLFDVTGLNAWNVLFGSIVVAWAVNRRRDGLTWDMPRHVTMLLLMFLGVVVIGVLRAAFDPGQYEEYPLTALVNDDLISTIKWVLPGVLLFDGCRTRRQMVMALVCLIVMYLLISVQVMRNIPPQAALGGGGERIRHAQLNARKQIGYHCTDLSVMLAGACWGTVAGASLVRRKTHQLMVLGTAAMLAYAQALTGGRGGYLAWGATGLVMSLLKWRRYLLFAPVLVMLLPIVFPGATQRMLAGFGQTDVAGKTTIDEELATSGRTLIWPYVIDKISESPWVGYGRLAMKRIGLYDLIETEHPGTGAPHPHNMYLETLLDNGIIGSVPILILFIVMAVRSARLFATTNRLYSAVGGMALALVLTQLFGGISGQHVYPLEQTVGMWAAMFLTLRVYVEENRAQSGATELEGPSSELSPLESQVTNAYAPR